MGAFHCAVCRQTFFCGKKHIFGKSHQSRLRVVLTKLIDKVTCTFDPNLEEAFMTKARCERAATDRNAQKGAKQLAKYCAVSGIISRHMVKEARRTMKSPQVERFDGAQHGGTFWCYCCGIELEKNVTDGNMVVLHGGLLEHMATAEHKKLTQKFWWEYKAEPKLRDKVLITTEDADRFKVEVDKALASYVEKEDTVLLQHTHMIQWQERRRLELIQSFTEPEVEQERPDGGQNQESPVEEAARPVGSQERAGPSRVTAKADGAGPGKGLTFIGHQDSSNDGNVHTGALPPWLQGDPPKEGSEGAEVGPSLQDFLKHKEQEKLKKLPPNRVGANFDHSSQTNADWLPSFGRVWNSGRRWQSRNQFREEEGKKKREKRGESRDSKRLRPNP